jgi:hypothetical protein
MFTQTPVELWKTSRQTAAQTAFTPNTNLRPTLQGLTNVSRDLPTEEALCLEIEKLCTTALTIDEAFYDIGRRLSDASKEQNKRVDLYDTCHTLETQWNEHHLVSSSFYELQRGTHQKHRPIKTSFGAPGSLLGKHKAPSTVQLAVRNTRRSSLF